MRHREVLRDEFAPGGDFPGGGGGGEDPFQPPPVDEPGGPTELPPGILPPPDEPVNPYPGEPVTPPDQPPGDLPPGGQQPGDQQPTSEPPGTTTVDPGDGEPPVGFDDKGNPIWRVTGKDQPPKGNPPTSQPPTYTNPNPGTQKTVTAPGPGGGSVVVNVQVTNAETIAEEALKKVSDAVNDGITKSTSAVADVVKGAIGDVLDGLKKVASTIWDAVKTALNAIASSIPKILSTIWRDLSAVVKDVVSGIGEVLSKISNTLVDVFNRVAPILDSIAKHIQRINDTLIQPVATFINTTMKTIGDLTTAIERDLHSGLSGLLKIPSDIAGAMTTLDATMQRTIEQLSKANTTAWAKITGWGDEDTAHTDFKKVTAALAGDNLDGGISTSYSKLRALSEHCDPVSAVNALQELGANIENAEGLTKFLLDAAIHFMLVLTQVGGTLEKIAEVQMEHSNEVCPIKKLDPVTLAQAVIRDLVSMEDALAEALKQGYDGNRFKTIHDLALQRLDAGTLLDLRHRGIITRDDLIVGCKHLGYTDSQIAALDAASVKLLDPNTAGTALQRALIEDDAFNAILSAQHYDAPQIDLLRTLLFRPSTSAEVLDARLNRELLGSFTLKTSDYDAVPEWFTAAGKVEGLDTAAIQQAWWRHWTTPNIQGFVNLYFRGIRTRTELEAVLTRNHVPPELHDDIIQTFRPLIPFRSIPSYVKSGILSLAQAEQELAGHGFDSSHINWILSAVRGSSTSTKSTAAAQVHTLSIAAARTLFIDGVYTEDEYKAVLESHGYTAALASSQVQADLLAEHAKARKQALADYAAQVETGTMTMDNAIAALSKAGFTDAEISRFQLNVQRQMVSKTKTPSIAELDKFFKAGLITIDQYKTALQTMGWTEPWFSAFIGLVAPAGS